MSAEVAALSGQTQGQGKVEKRHLPACQVWIRGRIKSSVQSEKGWYTQIVSPSPDEYSMPGVHDVSSTRSLGRPGNEIEILCHLSGFTKAGQNTRTGETFTITRNTLRIVEE